MNTESNKLKVDQLREFIKIASFLLKDQNEFINTCVGHFYDVEWRENLLNRYVEFDKILSESSETLIPKKEE